MATDLAGSRVPARPRLSSSSLCALAGSGCPAPHAPSIYCPHHLESAPRLCGGAEWGESKATSCPLSYPKRQGARLRRVLVVAVSPRPRAS